MTAQQWSTVLQGGTPTGSHCPGQRGTPHTGRTGFPPKSTSQRRKMPSRPETGGPRANARKATCSEGATGPPSPRRRPRGSGAGRRAPLTRPSAGPRTLERGPGGAGRLEKGPGGREAGEGAGEPAGRLERGPGGRRGGRETGEGAGGPGGWRGDREEREPGGQERRAD